jgi:hypothetical protein
MKRSGLKLLIILIGAGLLSGCVPATRFEWGNYETSLYGYYKSPDQRAQYENSLVKAIALGTKSGKIAPGLCAELGYMRMEDGDNAEAQKDFAEEMELFPESRVFLTGLIQRMAKPDNNGKGSTS